MGVRDAIILEKRSVRRISTRPTTTFKKFCPAVADHGESNHAKTNHFLVLLVESNLSKASYDATIVRLKGLHHELDSSV